MKNVKIYIGVLLIFNIYSYGQTKEERKEIISTYNKKEITLLNTLLIKNNIRYKKEIQDYLKNNPDVKEVIELNNGGLMQIKRIINNKPIYSSTDNVNSAKATRTNFLHNGGGLGLNLEGQNMHVATWDGGPTLSTHQEFLDDSASPITRVDNPDSSASNSQSDHSTHVSGTIIAKGVNASAKGMAPKATLTSFDWDFDDTEALDQATNNGLLLSNHSYGVPVSIDGNQNAPTWMMGNYNTEAVVWDLVAFSAPYYLMITSAGNDGNSTYTGGLANNFDKLTGNKNSKNNLVVANASNPLINPNGSGVLLSLFINTSSSQGPTDDGRVKPDITADGTSVFSSVSSTDFSYSTFTGTSMSAPNTTGTLLLLQQYYNQLNSVFMRSSTLKGLVCHTADDDFSSPGPDPIFGWGLLNAKRAVETIEKTTRNEAIILELTLNEGESYSFDFSATGIEPLSATICWTDPAGSNNSGSLNNPNPVLVNDLDLRINNTSSTFLPWKLQLSNVAGQAIKGDNIVDNVENVDIEFPVSGDYTVTVSHKSSLTNGSQQYALILTGSNLTLSTNEYSNTINNIFVWPNPVKDKLNLSFKPNDNKSKISIFDIHGRKVYQESIVSNSSNVQHSISTEQFSNGIYFLNIENGKNLYNKKIIIE